MLPRFREDFFFVPFVTCNDIRAAMHRGFASWSDNNARIAFHDVTSECAKISPTGEARHDCPLIEIWITHIGGDEEAATTEAAEEAVVNEDPHGLGGTTSAAALALPHAQRTYEFTYTNGVRPSREDVVETFGASISFNQGLCWYLDSVRHG